MYSSKTINKLTLLFGVLLCLVLVNARHYGNRNDEEENLRRSREHNSEGRDRKRRWQINSPPKINDTYLNVTKMIYEEDIDPNRNSEEVVSIDSEYKGTRPISSVPIAPEQLTKRPAPNVNNGSVQASITTLPPRAFEKAPAAVTAIVPVPSMCDAAILSCCGTSDKSAQLKQCFDNMSCGEIYTGGNACSPKSILSTLDSFKDFEKAPAAVAGNVPVPSMCDAAILSCCGTSDNSAQLKQCFDNMSCGEIYTGGNDCSPKSILSTLDSFKDFEKAPAAVIANVPVPSMCDATILSCCGTSDNTAQLKQCFDNMSCGEIYAGGNACSPKSILSTLDSFKDFEKAPAAVIANVPVPCMCDAAILSCCGTSDNSAQLKQCFDNMSCGEIYTGGNDCSPESILSTLDSFKAAYLPAN